MFIARFDIQNSPWVVSKPPLGEARPCLPSRTPGCFKVSMKARNWPSVETSSQQIEQIVSYFVPLLHHLFFFFSGTSLNHSESDSIGFHSLQSDSNHPFNPIQVTPCQRPYDAKNPCAPWAPPVAPYQAAPFQSLRKGWGRLRLAQTLQPCNMMQTLARRNKFMEEWILNRKFWDADGLEQTWFWIVRCDHLKINLDVPSNCTSKGSWRCERHLPRVFHWVWWIIGHRRLGNLVTSVDQKPSMHPCDACFSWIHAGVIGGARLISSSLATYHRQLLTATYRQERVFSQKATAQADFIYFLFLYNINMYNIAILCNKRTCQKAEAETKFCKSTWHPSKGPAKYSCFRPRVIEASEFL